MSVIYKTEVPESSITLPTRKKKQYPGLRPLPKGYEFATTKEKRIATIEMRKRILNNLHPLLDAEFQVAKGLTHVYRIDTIKQGKYERKETVLVTDPEEIRQFIEAQENGEEMDSDSYYFIQSKDPDFRAIDSLLDRVFGKSRQNISLPGTGDDDGEGGPLQITIINYANTSNNSVQLRTAAVSITPMPSDRLGLQEDSSSVAQTLGEGES